MVYKRRQVGGECREEEYCTITSSQRNAIMQLCTNIDLENETTEEGKEKKIE